MAVLRGPCGGSAPLIKRGVDPLDCRLNLAAVARSPGMLQNLAYIHQGADQRGNGRGWRGGHTMRLCRECVGN